MEGLDIESLDVQDAEILNAPEPEAPQAQAEVPVEAKAEPVIETAERARDPSTGKFVVAAPETPAPAAAEPVVQETPPPQKSEQKVIPLAAHLEERSRWRQELNASNQRIQDINKRLEELTPKAPEPDFLEDPKGYVDAKTTAAQKEVEALRQEAEGLRQQQAFVDFREQVGSAEASFVEKTPDYYDAINHVRAVRLEQLRELYPAETEGRLMQEIASEELRGAKSFMDNGRNPAEVAYKMAQTLGYRPKSGDSAKAAPASKLPNIPKAPVADPGSTLGSSGGDNPEEFDEMGENDLEPFEVALRERFQVRR